MPCQLERGLPLPEELSAPHISGIRPSEGQRSSFCLPRRHCPDKECGVTLPSLTLLSLDPLPWFLFISSPRRVLCVLEPFFPQDLHWAYEQFTRCLARGGGGGTGVFTSGRGRRDLPPIPWSLGGSCPERPCCSDWNDWHLTEYHLPSLPQALEEDLNQKKREQEMFFKLSEEAEPRPTTPNRASKFFPYSSGDAS